MSKFMPAEINNLTRAGINKTYFQGIIKKILGELRRSRMEISLAIVGEKDIKKLNRKYRNTNKVTDVLSFDYGEIIICYPQAVKQAKEKKHGIKAELLLLLMHGILHLAGYGDETEKERERMREKERELVKFLKFKI